MNFFKDKSEAIHFLDLEFMATQFFILPFACCMVLRTDDSWLVQVYTSLSMIECFVQELEV